LVCGNVNGTYYALQGECPRCGFDLYRGDLLSDERDIDAGWEDLPRVACPTCATTYSMKTGIHGPPIQRTGLQGFVTGLAKQSTSTSANKNAKVYTITVDDTDGTIYCR
jgi:nitrite reductase/ring-hydroxylating ferredoxin subunit